LQPASFKSRLVRFGRLSEGAVFSAMPLNGIFYVGRLDRRNKGDKKVQTKEGGPLEVAVAVPYGRAGVISLSWSVCWAAYGVCVTPSLYKERSNDETL
jgi:hypothetical protein